MERQAADWEKIFTNQISDKRLIFGIEKELSELNQKNPLRKWAKGMNRHFTEVDMQMENSTGDVQYN